MLKILFLLLLACPGFIWAACEDRLHGPVHPIVGLLERAIERQVLSKDDFKEFIERGDWSNPFERIETKLTTPHFRTTYAGIRAQMSAENLRVAAQQLRELQERLDGNAETSRKAKLITRELINPQRLLKILESFGADAHSHVTLVDGRPVILRPGYNFSNTGHAIAYLDPFNSDPFKHVKIISAPDISLAPPDILSVEGRLYAAYTRSAAVLDLTQKKLVKEAGSILWSLPLEKHKARIAKTANDLWLLAHNDTLQFKPLDQPQAAWRNFFPGAPANEGFIQMEQVLPFAEGDIVVAKGDRHYFFRDLSEREKFDPLPLEEFGGAEAVHGIRIFKSGIETFAVISKLRAIVVYNLTKKTQHEIELGSIYYFETVIYKNAIWLMATAKDREEVVMRNPVTGEQHTISAPGIRHGVQTFSVHDRQFLLWDIHKGIAVYDFEAKSAQQIALDIPGDVEHIQTLEYGNTPYLIIDARSAAPIFFRLTDRPLSEGAR